MGTAAARHNSFWMDSAYATPYDFLVEDTTTDVAIVGGGITGLTTAYLLASAGLRVMVVEAGSICAGATGFTTGKVTSQHGLVYARLVSDHGLERAQAYGEAQQAAIERIADIAAAESIDCDLIRSDAYVYAETAEQETVFVDELAAATRCGLPARDAGGDIGLPWDVALSIRFGEQALFHPRRYCIGLADAISRRGGVIVEQTRALGVDDVDGECVVTTGRGVVRANAVVLATQTPFVERGGFYARTTPMRSYVLAARWSDPPAGMFLSADTPTRSIRSHTDADGSVLIVGGGGHPTGREDNTSQHYADLMRFASERFAMKPDWQWSAQDFVPGDGLPFIGSITGGSPRTFVATGFAKWGMTNGTVAAMVITDAIIGRDNPWADTFDSTRVNARHEVRAVVSQGVETVKSVVGDRVAMLTAPSVDTLAPGEGAVVRVDGHAVAAFRHDDGTVTAVDARCTHLGCIVHFNDSERTWDCPCHGSRFALDGHVIDGPAVVDLLAIPSPSQ